MLSARKKKALWTFVGGLVSVGVGCVLWFTTETPEIVPVILQVIGAVGAIFGFTAAFPDTD